MKFELNRRSRSPEAYPQAETGVIGVRFRIADNEIAKLDQSLQLASQTITYVVARAMAWCAADLLAKAQPRVPWEDGLLRESGRASLTFGGSAAIEVAKGTKKVYSDTAVEVMFDKLKPSMMKYKITKLGATVSYQRTGDKGEDIALWTHEAIEPYSNRKSKVKGSGISYATKMGTGPKYLQIPWLENKDMYFNVIERAATSDSYRAVSQITKQKAPKGRYMASYYDIVMSRIQQLGYYGSVG